jgi:hypothetical protein
MERSARFELARSESLAGFADRCLQPLGHECDCGAPEGTRTPNLRFWKSPLYQLSYRYAVVLDGNAMESGEIRPVQSSHIGLHVYHAPAELGGLLMKFVVA